MEPILSDCTVIPMGDRHHLYSSRPLYLYYSYIHPDRCIYITATLVNASSDDCKWPDSLHAVHFLPRPKFLLIQFLKDGRRNVTV